MNEDRPKASVGLRIAALFCLGSVIFASGRIIGGHAFPELIDSLSKPPYWHKSMIIGLLPFGLFASAYILIKGRMPSFKKCPVELDENPYKTRFDKIGLAFIWTAILTFCGVVIYLCYFFE